MSRALIKHLWNQNRPQILANSLANCHAVGVHSLMLLDEPGRRIRLFLATSGHTLYYNREGASCGMSVAFHPHHCDITIEVVHGRIWNRTLNYYGGNLSLRKYRYCSQLRGEKPGFQPLWIENKFSSEQEICRSGGVIEMRAAEMHTVYLPAGEGAAWLIYDGREDPNYEPICWSNDDLENVSFAGMYQPMKEPAIERALCEVMGPDWNAL